MEVFDEYCERVGSSLLAEPINAISNVAFIVAAWAAWRLAKRNGTLPTGVKALIGLAGSTAIGSMLWHTFANTWSLYMDVIPIVLFMVGFLWLYVRDVMGKSAGFAALSLAAFFVSALLVRPIGDEIHGAPSYLPGLLLVLVLGLYHAIQRKPDRFTLLAAAGTYFTALFFRTIDNELCHYMTIGTHWIWHILIALVTYLVMRGVIVSLASSDPPPPKGKLWPRPSASKPGRSCAGAGVVLPRALASSPATKIRMPFLSVRLGSAVRVPLHWARANVFHITPGCLTTAKQCSPTPSAGRKGTQRCLRRLTREVRTRRAGQ